MSDRIAVMYLGKIVELSSNHDLYDHPLHPYTQALLSAAPGYEHFVGNKRIILEGDMPNPSNVPTGCAFHPRCPCRMDVCKYREPDLTSQPNGHLVACHLIN
jgi:oligopeptide transport system ATP-binding protein